MRLLGRPADTFPSELEAVWRLTSGCAISVVCDPRRTGDGLVTLALDDLDAQAQRLESEGLEFEEQAGLGAPPSTSQRCASSPPSRPSPRRHALLHPAAGPDRAHPRQLITHLRKLQDAGYLTTEKTGDGRASATSVALTRQGRAALESYAAALRDLLGEL